MTATRMRDVESGVGGGLALRALVVEDSPADGALMLHALKRGGYVVTADMVQSREEFLRQMRSQVYDIVLADYNLPQWTGLEALELLREEGLDIPLILVTGALGDEKAVESIKQGAADYVLKQHLARLPVSLHRALVEKGLREERKRAEQTVRESLVTSERALKELADQKFALDQHAEVSTTDVEGRITYANDRFCSVSKYSREELIGRNHRMLNSGLHPQEFFRDVYDTLGRGEVWQGEIRNRAKDGEIYWSQTTIVPFLGADGKPRQYIAMRANITERKRAEEDLAKKMNELACSNEQLEQFAYVASHDLQEPLRIVANYTQLLAERYRGHLDEQADKYIYYAIDGSTRMQAMIQDLLAFSRAGRQDQDKDVRNIDSTVAVEQALKNLSAAIAESGAVVKHDRLPMVKANSIQITQVFQNLIGNAIKFHGSDAAVVKISAGKQGDEWIFSVADNGIGIAAEHSEVIFAIFQRLHTRTEYSGNGIGLSICKKIVERHGGRIWLDVKASHGATFKFTLPAGTGKEKEKEVEGGVGCGKSRDEHAIHV